MLQVTIERSKWLHGEGLDKSKLLRPSDGKLCCHGFYARALGFSDDVLREQPTWLALKEEHPTLQYPEWCVTVGVNGPDVGHSYNVNDDYICSDSVREQKLKTIFARHDVELVFVD
jgi:hypothetical protein